MHESYHAKKVQLRGTSVNTASDDEGDGLEFRKGSRRGSGGSFVGLRTLR